MTPVAHAALRRAEPYFESRQSMADAVGMPRTTLVGYLDSEPGSLEYSKATADETRLVERLISAAYGEGRSAGFEDGQQADPDLPDEEERRFDGDTLQTIKNVKDPVQTPEEAARHFDIDLDRYYADTIECGKHQVPVSRSVAGVKEVEDKERLVREDQVVVVECYRLNVRWKPHAGKEMAAAFCEQVMEGYEGASEPDVPLPPEEGLVRTISIPDLHLGNLIWAEQGEMAWDLEIGTRQWKEAFAYLLSDAREEGVTDLVFDIGNDAAHANGSRGQSANGTQYTGVAPAYQTSKRLAEAYMWAIEKAREQGLRVHAVVVRGNHDWDPAMHLGQGLWMRYKEWEGVTIYQSQDPWQFLQFGTCLLGFAHGKGKDGYQLKTDQLYALAAEQPAWPECDYVEIRTGHTHTRELDSVGGYVEQNGVLIRTSPSLCPADMFHKVNLYHDALRAAERYDLHPQHGLVSHAPYLPDLIADS